MDSACECERTARADLAQSLHLINSDAMHSILAASNGRAVTLSREKDRDDKVRVAELYLHALSRHPTGSELEVALAHIERKKLRAGSGPTSTLPGQAVKEAYEDIIWVVVNTKEFLFNH